VCEAGTTISRSTAPHGSIVRGNRGVPSARDEGEQETQETHAGTAGSSEGMWTRVFLSFFFSSYFLFFSSVVSRLPCLKNVAV